MRKIVASPRNEELSPAHEAEPNPMWALAVGLVYVFRTGPGHRILRDLEHAVRRYASDPAALWRLVRNGEEIIDATTAPDRDLPGGAAPELPRASAGAGTDDDE